MITCVKQLKYLEHNLYCGGCFLFVSCYYLRCCPLPELPKYMERGITLIVHGMASTFRLRPKTYVGPRVTDHPSLPVTFPSVCAESPASWGTPQFWDSAPASTSTFVATVLAPGLFSFLSRFSPSSP